MKTFLLARFRFAAVATAFVSLHVGVAFGFPVWNAGNGNLTFDPGNGDAPTVVAGAIPDWFGPAPTFPINQSVSDGAFNTTAKAGFFHVEVPNLFGLVIPAQTKLSQSNADAVGAGPASLNLGTVGPSQWTIQSTPFGPTMYGFVLFPYIYGQVAPGEGSFVSLSVTASFGPESTRAPFQFNATYDDAGAFAVPSIVDFMEMAPNFLNPGDFQQLQFSVSMTAYGVGGLSEIILGSSRDPGAPPLNLPIDIIIPDRRGGIGGGATAGDPALLVPVPEPSTYAIFAAIGLIGLTVIRRWRSRATSGDAPVAIG